MSDERFKHESMQDTESILKYLDALRSGFETGQIVFSSKTNEVILEPEGLVQFELDAKKKGNRRKLILKFSWKEESEETVKDDSLMIEPR